MKKKLSVMAAEIEADRDANVAAMKNLLEKFRAEFPPCVGYTGYLLVGVDCGKKPKKNQPVKEGDCLLCPHSLAWRKFDYRFRFKSGPKAGKGAFYWVRTPRLTFLPAAFLNVRKKSTVRFRYYNDRMRKLNAQRKKLSEAVRAVHAAYRSIKKSRVFYEDTR
jgi:hypothetical protein